MPDSVSRRSVVATTSVAPGRALSVRCPRHRDVRSLPLRSRCARSSLPERRSRRRPGRSTACPRDPSLGVVRFRAGRPGARRLARDLLDQVVGKAEALRPPASFRSRSGLVATVARRKPDRQAGGPRRSRSTAVSSTGSPSGLRGAPGRSSSSAGRRTAAGSSSHRPDVVGVDHGRRAATAGASGLDGPRRAGRRHAPRSRLPHAGAGRHSC